MSPVTWRMERHSSQVRALQALDRVAMATATGVNQEEKMAPCSPRQFATCDEVTYSVCIEGLPHGTNQEARRRQASTRPESCTAGASSTCTGSPMQRRVDCQGWWTDSWVTATASHYKQAQPYWWLNSMRTMKVT